jgi:hypothetical protein
MNWPQEFLDLDQRSNPVTGRQPYQITQEYLYNKHRILLPSDFVKNKRVLDLGSCLGASGFWCLSNGASYYRGIEIQSWFIDKSRELLAKHCGDTNWHVEYGEINSYLDQDDGGWDVILLWGVLNAFVNPTEILEKVFTKTNMVSIDMPIPSGVRNPWDEMDHRSIDLNPSSSMIIANESASNVFVGSRIGLGALDIISKVNQFEMDISSYEALQEALPDTYGAHSKYRRTAINLHETQETLQTYTATYKQLPKEEWK